MLLQEAGVLRIERCLQSMLSGLAFGLFQRNFIQELGAFDFKVRLSLLFLPLRFGQFAWTICGCLTFTAMNYLSHPGGQGLCLFAQARNLLI